MLVAEIARPSASEFTKDADHDHDGRSILSHDLRSLYRQVLRTGGRPSNLDQTRRSRHPRARSHADAREEQRRGCGWHLGLVIQSEYVVAALDRVHMLERGRRWYIRTTVRFLLNPWGVILQAVALIHFIRRRPDTYWLFIIIFLGPLGALVYIFIEVIPDLGLLRHSF